MGKQGLTASQSQPGCDAQDALPANAEPSAAPYTCPTCGEEPRMVWIGNDPPEPYGEVCGCPDPEYADARDEKAADEREAFFDRGFGQ